MSNAKEIRSKIKSVKNTQKITRAMEMVAASKMKKAQDRMLASRPYAEKIEEVISHVADGSLDYSHPYLEKRDISKAGFLLISTDRGLCGGLNINLFKSLVTKLGDYQQKNVDVQLGILGKKGLSFFNKLGCDIVATTEGISDAPAVKDMLGVLNALEQNYVSGELDVVYLAYNEFKNTMSQEPVIKQLLPIVPPEKPLNSGGWEYLYEPDANYLLDNLLARYVESIVYQAMVEGVACEQAARMVAMKSASDNASDLIDDFQLKYNKARQAAITQELSEIVAGAAAV